MTFLRRSLIGGLLAATFSLTAQAQQAITLHGASQFGDDHAFTKTMVRFEELVKKYYGKPIKFVLHKNSELGLEKDYFAYMNQGISVDYAIMENARRIATVIADFDWDDVGLWTALPRHLKTDAAGNATRGAVYASGAGNNIAVSNGRVIALCGVKDLVVVETADAVLVCHRDAVQDIKKIVQQLPQELT